VSDERGREEEKETSCARWFSFLFSLLSYFFFFFFFKLHRLGGRAIDLSSSFSFVLSNWFQQGVCLKQEKPKQNEEIQEESKNKNKNK